MVPENSIDLSELNSLKESVEIKSKEILSLNSTIKSLNSDFESQRKKSDLLLKEVFEHQKNTDRVYKSRERKWERWRTFAPLEEITPCLTLSDNRVSTSICKDVDSSIPGRFFVHGSRLVR